jgi:hypothetical protein
MVAVDHDRLRLTDMENTAVTRTGGLTVARRIRTAPCSRVARTATIGDTRIDCVHG